MPNEIRIQYVKEIDRGLTYAEACFETFRVINGHIFEWEHHWQRLQLGLSAFGITYAANWQNTVLTACLQQARNTADDCLIRLTISGGQATWGLTRQAQPNFSIQVMPFLATSTTLCAINVEYPFPLRPKPAKFTADYAEILRAIQIWRHQHPNIDPQQYILCKDGRILSGLTSNIILYHQGRWLTPQGDGILHGIIRQFLLEKKFIQLHACPITLLDTCESIVLLNSGQFIRPAQQINNRNLLSKHTAITNIRHILTGIKGVKIADF